MDIKTEIMQICELSDNHKCKVFGEFNTRFVVGFRDFDGFRQWFYYMDNSTSCTVWRGIDEIIKRVKPVRILYK